MAKNVVGFSIFFGEIFGEKKFRIWFCCALFPEEVVGLRARLSAHSSLSSKLPQLKAPSAQSFLSSKLPQLKAAHPSHGATTREKTIQRKPRDGARLRQANPDSDKNGHQKFSTHSAS